MDHEVEEWFKVPDVASLTYEEDKKKRITSKKMSVDKLPTIPQP